VSTTTRALIAAGVIALASCGGNGAEGPTPPAPSAAPSTPSTAPSVAVDPDATGAEAPTPSELAHGAGQRFLATYVAPHGRVVRHDQGGDTVSEGQAYAMLVAVALGDEETFASVWAWTKDHLRRSDGLLAWRWHDGAVVDWQVAADADLDTAHALFLAAARFDEPGYHDDARRLADAMHRHLTIPLDAGQLLVAGPWAVDEQVWNPSYLSPLAFSILYRHGDDPRWAEVASTSRVLVDRLTAEPPHLPPDWARLTSAGPVPHGDPPTYGYDAVRTPWRFALDCDPHGVDLAARPWPLLARLTDHGSHPPPAVLSLDGSVIDETGHPAATVAAAASAAAAREPDAAQQLLALAEAQDQAQPTYYGAALVALGRLGLDTELLGACPERTG
jgi:endoglucanase